MSDTNAGFPAQVGMAPPDEDEGNSATDVDPEPITPEPDDTELTNETSDDVPLEVDDDPNDPLDEPVQADDESDDEYAARVRSWRGKKAARTRAENRAAANRPSE